jgi:hypothetical protein
LARLAALSRTDTRVYDNLPIAAIDLSDWPAAQWDYLR